MSIFEMSKYVTDDGVRNSDGVEVPEEKGHMSEHDKATAKEIKIVSLKDKPASQIVAESLIEALRREDILLLKKPEESSNGIFGKIKFVSTEDINNNLEETLGFVKDGGYIVTDVKMPNTIKEQLFDDAVVNNPEAKIYYNNPKKALVDLYNEMLEEEVPETTNEIGIDLHNSFPGDRVTINDVCYEVVFRDSFVVLLREEDQHPSTKDNYLLVDCPKGE